MSAAGLRVFDALFTPWRRRRLAGIHLAGLPRALPAARPLVLIANHTSWWDGFLLREVHRALRPDAHLATIMLERELKRFPFFRQLGAEPVQPGSRASVRALVQRLQALRARDPEFVLSFFPQGRIWPADRRPLGFVSGIDRLVRRIAPVVVLPVALRVEPLHRVAPTAFVVAGEPLEAGDGARLDVADLEAAVTARLDALRDVLARDGEHVTALWPGDAFAPIGHRRGVPQ